MIPSNVGLKDPTLASMISKYNEQAMERARLLRTVSETSPTVTVITNQLEMLLGGIKSSLASTKRQLNIQRSNLQGQQNKYASRISAAPTKERAMVDINRQQEVKAGLYLMLLQKREENAITLASAAYKGKMIEEPIVNGAPISPKSRLIYLIAFAIGFVLPCFQQVSTFCGLHSEMLCWSFRNIPSPEQGTSQMMRSNTAPSD